MVESSAFQHNSEAATPYGFSGCASASLKPSGNPSRRRTASITTSLQSLQRLKHSHACSESTLRQDGFCRNGKIDLSCEETVEDETFLWKVWEKSVFGFIFQFPVLGCQLVMIDF
ncbi:MAG TPA: hypothetical protein VGF44_11785 [Terriglobales bacterium]